MNAIELALNAAFGQLTQTGGVVLGLRGNEVKGIVNRQPVSPKDRDRSGMRPEDDTVIEFAPTIEVAKGDVITLPTGKLSTVNRVVDMSYYIRCFCKTSCTQ